MNAPCDLYAMTPDELADALEPYVLPDGTYLCECSELPDPNEEDGYLECGPCALVRRLKERLQN